MRHFVIFWATASLMAFSSLVSQAQSTLHIGPSRTYRTLHEAVAAKAVVSGMRVELDNGTYLDKTMLDGVSNVTITSATGRAGGVIFDGGGQDNLAMRKAILLVENCPGLVLVGLRFKNAGLGGPAGVAAQGLGAGNQAAISYENATGTARVSYCSFDNCVTGIFGRSGATALDLTVDHCDFGYEVSNGQAQDGYSHDMYLGPLHSFTGVDNNWYGDKYANNCKSRALTNTISGGYNANYEGRCVDLPSAGHYSITGGIYVRGMGPNSQVLAYGEEDQNNGGFSGTIDGITLRITNRVSIWNNVASTTMAFTNPTLAWYGTSLNGIGLQGPGAITGLSAAGASLLAASLPAPPPPVSSTVALAAAHTTITPSTLSVYPNPTAGLFTLRTSLLQTGSVTLAVHDGAGRPMYTSTHTIVAGPQSLLLNLSSLPAGLYLLRVQMPGQADQTQQIVIRP